MLRAVCHHRVEQFGVVPANETSDEKETSRYDRLAFNFSTTSLCRFLNFANNDCFPKFNVGTTVFSSGKKVVSCYTNEVMEHIVDFSLCLFSVK